MLRVIFSLGFLQVITTFINMVRAKVFALLLGPAGFGVVATIDQLVLSTTQIANLSLPFTALKFLSHDHSLGEAQYRRTYTVFLHAITLVAFLATVLAVSFLPPNLGNIDPQLARYEGPVQVALLGVPAAMLLVFFTNVLASRQRTIQSILLNLFSALVVMAFGALGCWLDGIKGIYFATVPASTLLIVGMALYARIKLNLPLGRTPRVSQQAPRTNRQVFETAAFTYVAVVSHSALLLLARYQSITHLGEEAAGLLQACLSVALAVGAVLLPATSLYFTPLVNRAGPASDKIRIADAFLPQLIFIYSSGAMVILLFPQFVLRVLFSDRFAAATPMLPWFILWQCLFQVANTYQQLLIGLDDVRGCCILIVAGNIIAIGLVFALTSPFGLIGIGAAFVAGAAAIATAAAVRLHLRYSLPVPWSIPALLTFAIAGFAAIAALGRFTSEQTLAGLGARSLIALFFLAGLSLLVPRSLRSEVSQALAARLGRNQPKKTNDARASQSDAGR